MVKLSKAQLNKLQLQDRDIVVMRWCDPTAEELRAGQRAITEAIAAAGVQAIGICVGDHIDVEQIVGALTPEALQSRCMQDLAILREKLQTTKRRLSDVVRQYRADIQALQKRIDLLQMTQQRDVASMQASLARQQDELAQRDAKIKELQQTRHQTLPRRLTKQDLNCMETAQLRRYAGTPCEFKGCRYYRGVGANFCLTHGAVMRAIERREREVCR